MIIGSGLGNLREHLKVRSRVRMDLPGFRRAAVFVPILQSGTDLEILFTVRGSELSNHAGQIAFPGGAIDPGETVEEAALRETEEEIGFLPPAAGVLGRLDDHPTPARFVVTPVVGVVPWPQELAPNPREVAEVFSVPLPELQGVEPRWEARQLEGMTRRIHFYSWGERLIWGFTGNVLKELLDALAEANRNGTFPRDSLAE